MDITMFTAVLIAGLIECSDVQGLIESVNADRYLTSDAKIEIVEILIQGTSQCELKDGSEVS
tara:strand:+ start:39 stop:224 length:186 start_codon:yes stop_codon:yes gene_type:complete